MNKMQIAHDYALEMAKQGIPLKSCKELGWKYADAMQAEAEKREDKTRPDVLKEEWQPDWSQAPDDLVKYFAVDEDGRGGWYINKPDLCFAYWNWSGWGERARIYEDADNFGYQGNWQDSLRKRPESIKNIDPKEYIDAVLQDIVDPCDHEWTHISKFGAEGDFYVCPCGAESKHARGRK